MNRFVQWILSKLFPYNDVAMVEEPIVSVRNWDKRKFDESEQFYGGQNGTGRN